MPKKIAFEECYVPGLLVNLYALMEAEGTRPGMASFFFAGWVKEATISGRGGVPWVYFRVPYRAAAADETRQQHDARHAGMRDQVLAAREFVTKNMGVPAVLWCSEWGPPRAPDAPPPKGKHVDPQKAYARAVRELRAAIKAHKQDINATLDELETQAAQAEAEGWEIEEYPSFVGCLDPTTGVVYEAGIEWPQYFRGCGGPGPWNEIVAFSLDLATPAEMVSETEGAVGEAFDMAGIEL